MGKEMSPNEKLSELILACIKHGADKDGRITKTKLAKLVYLADFAFFYKKQVPISGVVYRKMKQGPVSLDYFDQIVSLLGDDKIKLEKKGRAHLFSLNKNDVKLHLGRSELQVVKEVCSKWKDKTTKEIVNFTHKQLPWKISFKDDEIPYELIIQQDAESVF